MRHLAAAFAVALVALAIAAPLGSRHTRTAEALTCGEERWPVKTLSDADAAAVDFAPVPSTVAQLRALPAPATHPADSRIAPTELTTYAVTANVVKFKLEDDRDIHVVISDLNDPAQTMIVEFPDAVNCDGASTSAHAAEMQAARSQLVARYGNPPSSSFRNLTGTATFVGVAFFDFKHGQTGVAPNAIELHPVISFTSSATDGLDALVLHRELRDRRRHVQLHRRRPGADAPDGRSGSQRVRRAAGRRRRWLHLPAAGHPREARLRHDEGRRLWPSPRGSDRHGHRPCRLQHLDRHGLRGAGEGRAVGRQHEVSRLGECVAGVGADGAVEHVGAGRSVQRRHELRRCSSDAAAPTPPPAPTPRPTATPASSSGNCDSSYPTVCIPPPPPDLDCGDIPYRNFPVNPPDPHHFDGDHDGIGCES